MNNRYREEELAEKENLDEEELTEGETLDDIHDSNVEEESVDDSDVNKSSKHDKKNKKIQKLNEKIQTLEEELKKSNAQYLRLLADSENYKKRIDDERIRERKYACQRLLEKLVTNIDIFDKACNMKTDDQNLNNFLIGFQMINNNIINILEEEGVKKINCKGMFDPRFHHAVETDYDETKEEDEILAVIKDGYMYKDRILVAAMVKVNKKPVDKSNETEKINNSDDNSDK